MPTDIVGIIVLVAAFAPGFAWIRVAETRTLRAERSALLETAELGIVGAAATLMSAAAIALLSSWLGLGLANLKQWASQGSRYFAEHPVEVIVTLAVVVGMSILLAWGAARIVYRDHPRVFGPERTVWSDVLSESGRTAASGLTRAAFVAARTKDNRIFEGYLRSFSAGPTDTVNEVALQAPIYVRDSPDAKRVQVANIQYLILLVNELRELAVSYEEVKVVNKE